MATENAAGLSIGCGIFFIDTYCQLQFEGQLVDRYMFHGVETVGSFVCETHGTQATEKGMFIMVDRENGVGIGVERSWEKR